MMPSIIDLGVSKGNNPFKRFGIASRDLSPRRTQIQVCGESDVVLKKLHTELLASAAGVSSFHTKI